MYLSAELGRLDVASLVLALLQKYSGLRAASPADCMNLIKAFGQAKRPGDALRVLHVMNQGKGDVEPYPLARNARATWSRILSRAMYLSAELGRLDVASLVLALLQKYSGLRAASPAEYMNLIKAFGQAKRPGTRYESCMS
ncbi:hypothetical protein NSK_005410 [Nannochloropsis salina CCMP1776]|uniref:Uncharacterized protein n=1 Tax=Nannochloropsis salina CCMP1776 TaxID=1027361 RepID=A0A4D9CYK3_9STRA|nr:hypothetical protein NSK_005410 [Nannochloropsis salina CCMP1776]|eukprot:TFJ83287.1 hypothetical protein NSK_005410 [Nannochloropsis salina CCMP1776]